jgi:hypothetical protein
MGLHEGVCSHDLTSLQCADGCVGPFCGCSSTAPPTTAPPSRGTRCPSAPPTGTTSPTPAVCACASTTSFPTPIGFMFPPTQTGFTFSPTPNFGFPPTPVFPPVSSAFTFAPTSVAPTGSQAPVSFAPVSFAPTQPFPGPNPHPTTIAPTARLPPVSFAPTTVAPTSAVPAPFSSGPPTAPPIPVYVGPCQPDNAYYSTTLIARDANGAFVLEVENFTASGVGPGRYEGPTVFVNSDAFVNTARVHTQVPLERSWYDSCQHGWCVRFERCAALFSVWPLLHQCMR